MGWLEWGIMRIGHWSEDWVYCFYFCRVLVLSCDLVTRPVFFLMNQVEFCAVQVLSFLGEPTAMALVRNSSLTLREGFGGEPSCLKASVLLLEVRPHQLQQQVLTSSPESEGHNREEVL